MRFTTIGLVLAIGAALALPAAATANPAYEPNDGIDQAYGPLAASTNYDATISSANEADWYVVYASGPGVLDIEVTNLDDTACCIDVYLMDHTGETLSSIFVDEGPAKHLTYTTPGAGAYYVWVGDSGAGDRYRLRLTGPITDGPRPGPPEEVVPNNNHEAATAFGPLAGDRLYGGSIDAVGEEDWFVFNTAGAGAIDVAITNVARDTGCCIDAALIDQDGETLSSVFVDKDTIGHLTYTAPAAVRLFLWIGDSGPVDQYQFRISPGGLVSPNTPPAASSECADAEANLAKAKDKLAKAKAAVASAFTKGAKKKAKAKVKKAKAKVRAAKQQVSAACG